MLEDPTFGGSHTAPDGRPESAVAPANGHDSTDSASGSEEAPAFDFEAHRLRAVDRYQKARPLYEGYSECVRSLLRAALDAGNLKVANLEARAKAIDSFGSKSIEPADSTDGRPKYPDPLTEITDLAGARVIVFFPDEVGKVNDTIYAEFEVIEKSDKSEALRQEGKFGYQSVHYLVRLRDNRTCLPEYKRYTGMVAEIQVRTILQHAWAEIEHDIQYKSADVIPEAIRRRFMALAGLLEIADREFQAIQQEDKHVRVAARRSVALGDLAKVEITPDALKAYLDKRLGPDGRVSETSYEIEARILRNMGFNTMAQVDECIAPYDDDQVSRAIWNYRQGQITRLDGLIMAGMGDNYLVHRSWGDDWYRQYLAKQIQRLRDSEIVIGSYAPPRENSGG